MIDVDELLKIQQSLLKFKERLGESEPDLRQLDLHINEAIRVAESLLTDGQIAEAVSSKTSH